jgi:hypothetical protein
MDRGKSSIIVKFVNFLVKSNSLMNQFEETTVSAVEVGVLSHSQLIKKGLLAKDERTNDVRSVWLYIQSLYDDGRNERDIDYALRQNANLFSDRSKFKTAEIIQDFKVTKIESINKQGNNFILIYVLIVILFMS